MKRLIVLLSVFAVLISFCTKDKMEPKKEEVALPPPPPPSYCDSMKTNNIVSWGCDSLQTFFTTYCAFSNCHNNNPEIGDWQPNLTNYNEIFNHKAHIKERVVVIKDMPQTCCAPAFPADSLRNKIGSWIDAGASNN